MCLLKHSCDERRIDLDRSLRRTLDGFPGLTGRSAVSIALLWLFLFANLCFITIMQEWGGGLTSARMVVQVDLGENPRKEIPQVSALNRKGSQHSLLPVNSRWTEENAFVSEVRLSLTQSGVENLRGVRVALGDSVFEFSREKVLQEWRKSGEESGILTFDLPASVTLSKSALPFLRNVRNWPGDGIVLGRLLGTNALNCSIGVLLVLLALHFVPLSQRTSEVAPAAPGMLRLVGLFCLLFAVAYAAFYLSLKTFDDTASPRGDAWEYQSIAVNLLTGHGLNRVGTLEPLETYKFKSDARDTIDYRQLGESWGGRFRAYRTPGYPAFLAGIYSVTGISPLRAKQTQLLLLIVSAACLPFLGYWYWRSAGFYGGILAGVLFLGRWHHTADRLYTESLIAATVMLFSLCLLSYQHRPRLATAGVLGFLGGMAMLVKGDLIFLAPLTFVFLAVQTLRKNVGYWHMAIWAIFCIAPVLPWSVYATHQTGQFTVLTIQASEIMLDGNNELTWEDGGWHPEFRNGAFPAAFYNRADIASLSTPQKVLKFYTAYPEKIPAVIYNKLKSGFGAFPYLRVALVLVLFGIFAVLRAPVGKTRAPDRVSIAAGLLVIIAAYDIVLLLGLFGAAMIFLLYRRRVTQFLLPLPIVIPLGNFFLISLLVFGDSRFVSVIDNLFTLTALSFLLSVFLSLYETERSDSLVRDLMGAAAVATRSS